MNSTVLWIWLSLKCGADSPIFSRLYSKYNDIEKIYSLVPDELIEFGGLSKKQIDNLSEKSTAKAEEILKRCKRENIGILPFSDDCYPSRLRTIKNPPIVLYYKGNFPDIDKEVCIGTVGTRTPSSYGCRCAYEISYDLAANGAYVISGMAFGIDSVCHRAALDAGGKTIAILGCGVDIVYPKENSELYARIAVNGTLISEYAPGTSPAVYSFPQRNRIISGLSLGTLIIESKLKSGAMITAKKTLDQNRDLFAVPGRVGEYNSMGPNSLIKHGAITVSSANDILKEYEFLYPDKIRTDKKSHIKNNPYTNSGESVDFGSPSKTIRLSKESVPIGDGQYVSSETKEPNTQKDPFQVLSTLSDEHQKICLALSKNCPRSAEDLSRTTNFNISDILTSLTILEIQGIVKAVPGGNYILA